MAKKYIVRAGFVVVLQIKTRDEQGNVAIKERTYESGDEVSLEDDDAALHQHKLEFASQKDRDAALAAEQAAAQAALQAQATPDLLRMIADALAGRAAAAAPAAPAA